VLRLRQERTRAATSSKFRGVNWKPRDRRWEAKFNYKGKQTSLGYFTTEEGAARAFDRMAVSCELHKVTRRGRWKLNYPRADYEGEQEELRDITMEDLVTKLQQQGREQRAVANNAEGDEGGEGAGGGSGWTELGDAGDDAGGGESEDEGDGAPTSRPNTLPLVGAGASGVTVKEEEEEETLGQLRDRLGLETAAWRAPVAGPRATFVHIKVEDTTSGEDTDGTGRGE